jgi:hypothetical protein
MKAPRVATGSAGRAHLEGQVVEIVGTIGGQVVGSLGAREEGGNLFVPLGLVSGVPTPILPESLSHDAESLP